MTGTTIGQYQVLEKLGEGGMGVVYKARDARLGRFVALKLLPPGREQSREIRERFLNEARTASSLGHPNIVIIHDITDHQGTDCLVMEFIPGKTLEQKLRDEGVPRLRDAVDYAIQVADALAAAHRAGIVHRDLKPGNVMITPDGLVKVVDFGLAKLAAAAEPPAIDDPVATRKALTGRGTIIGTAAYMSPEQAEGKPLDARSDIFSFGALLYEMSCGLRAFQGDSAVSTLAAVLREDPIPLPQRDPNVPRGLDLVVGGCLKKDPGKRFQHMTDVRLVLERVREEIDSGVRPPTSTTATATALAVAPSALRGWPVLAAALAILLVGLGAGWVARGGFGIGSRSSANLPRKGPMRLSRLTFGTVAAGPALSPDGNLVAFIKAHPTGLADLVLTPVQGGQEVLLVKGGRISNPRFSVDGSKVYFILSSEPRGAYEVPILGGEPRLLLPGASHVVPSPDGQWLALVVRGKLLVQPAAGGEAKQISESGGIGGPVWSPDSTRLLTHVNPGTADADLLLVPAAGGPASSTGLFAQLRARGQYAAYIVEPKVWLPNGDLIFCAPMGAALNLWRLPIANLKDGEPVPLTNGTGSNCDAALVRDRLVFAHRQQSHGVWRVPASLNEGRMLGQPVLLTPEGVESQFPDISPDGRFMAFTAVTGAGQGAYLMDLARGSMRQLAVLRHALAYTTFSPDGSKVAFGAGNLPGWPVYSVPTVGGEPVELGKAHGRIRGWSADGRYLLIWRTLGRLSVGVFDVIARKDAEIVASSKMLLSLPRLSPDGRWVLFSAAATPADLPNLYAVPFRGSQAVAESEWIPIANAAENPVWSPDGRWLHYIDRTASTLRLMRQRVEDQHRPVGDPTVLYAPDSRAVPQPLFNTMKATQDSLYLLLRDGPSSLWVMDYPQ